MLDTLTIRNLTAQALVIKLVERYEAPTNSSNAGFSVNNITSNITTLFGNGTSPAPKSNELAARAETFTKQDVNLRVEPFMTHTTDIKAHGAGEILRLTMEGGGGGRWRVETPTPSSSSSSLSQQLTPLDGHPAGDYTAVYLPTGTLLAVLESLNAQKWMQAFQNTTPLSALSIPGTHNSPTCHKALPSVRCQAVSPIEQLRNGVRFFDIRVQPLKPDDPKDSSLALVHGVFPVSLTGPKKFHPLIEEVLAFLREHPSETVVLSLKREGPGSATDAQLSSILHDHYANDATWYTEPRIPTLGEVRGKIVLMRRFALADRLKTEHDGRGWALNAENWAYNTPNDTHGDVQVQDFCEVLETENIDHKIDLCCEHFERAGAVVSPVPGVTTDSTNPVPAGPLYLNFLSASNFWKVGCWPEKIAAKLNPAVLGFLCERHDVGDKGLEGPGEKVNGDGGTGIVVCDWVGKDGDWDLVKTIIGMNGRLLLRQQGSKGPPS